MPAAKPDCTRKIFGHLKVIGKSEKRKTHGGKTHRLWQLECICGKQLFLERYVFDRPNGQKSCGCQVNRGKPPTELTGKRFGSLEAIEITDKRDCGAAVWRCRCDCGNTCFIDCRRLNDGFRLNCGDKNNHHHGLKYPETPKILPDKVWETIVEYLPYTQYRGDKNNQAIEDEKRARLTRVAWIIYWREQQGEELSDLYKKRYIFKYLRLAYIATKIDDYRKKRQIRRYTRDDISIGCDMTDVIDRQYPGEDSQGEIKTRNFKKRYKFKTC